MLACSGMMVKHRAIVNKYFFYRSPGNAEKKPGNVFPGLIEKLRLCNESGLEELLDFDFKKHSHNSLYKISDKLLSHKLDFVQF